MCVGFNLKEERKYENLSNFVLSGNARVWVTKCECAGIHLNCAFVKTSHS